MLQKFSLLLRILSGFHWHVCPLLNKTFIFNSIFYFIRFFLLFKTINKHPNRLFIFCYLFSYLDFEYSQKVCDGCTIFEFIRHVRPSQVNMMFSIPLSLKEWAALLAWEHTKHQIKCCRVRKELLFFVFFCIEIVFFKSTKKGREVFRTCKLHTLLAVE